MSKCTATRVLALVTIVVLATFPPIMTARGQSIFEKLVLPGDVVAPHAKLESKCESCHEPFSKSSQRRLCLECHKEVNADIVDKKGFHGKRPEIKAAECKTCHTDHKGRNANIVPLDEATFNHAFTDFALNGAHKVAACSSCHAAGKPHRTAPGACIDCHKRDDAHRGNLGVNCASCHREDDWRKPKTFDHAKTAFPLEGAHSKVACATCHVGERYKGLPHGCVNCHKVQDVHGGRFGTKCDRCHSVKQWKTVRFDHAKETKFPLKGAHEKATCNSCHKGGVFDVKLQTACVSCHRSQDPHKGQLGAKCENCHNEASWQQRVSFDHELSRFPLIGLHAKVPCEECHRTTEYRGAPMNCSACHKDTHHQGALGSTCEKCHTPNGWALWRFDHDRQTQFPLTGAHKALVCSACHANANGGKASAPTTCFGCHASDDAHRGAFGRTCDTCHTTESFRTTVRTP